MSLSATYVCIRNQWLLLLLVAPLLVLLGQWRSEHVSVFWSSLYPTINRKTELRRSSNREDSPLSTGDVLVSERGDLPLGSANRRNDEALVVLLSLTCAVVHISINLPW